MATRKHHIERLQRRAEHLRVRVTENPRLTYDVAELNALDWAIEVLSALVELRISQGQ